jgi:hypothetical protein
LFSPDGPARVVAVETGTPRFGVPSGFQEIRCARLVRVVPHPWEDEELAW